jgi:hypothetical protein
MLSKADYEHGHVLKIGLKGIKIYNLLASKTNISSIVK